MLGGREDALPQMRRATLVPDACDEVVLFFYLFRGHVSFLLVLFRMVVSERVGEDLRIEMGD